MGINSFSGSQKVGMLLLSFGEEISAEIFKHFNEFEVKRIGTAMSRLGRLDQEVVDEVIVEFYNLLQQNKQFFYGGTDYTKKLIGTAFKGGEADEIMNQLMQSSSNLDSLSLIDPRNLAGFLRNEHPQTMALILAHLDPVKFGEVLKLLPQNLHTEIMYRVAYLDAVAPEIIEEIEEVLRQEVQSMSSIATENLGGVDSIADMMNLMDKASEEKLLENLEERDPELAEQIRQLMFVFDDLVKLDDRSMQEVVKAVPADKWKYALKSASEEIKGLVFKNMSQRASQMLAEDIEAMGSVKLSDVEAAQVEVLKITRKLEEEGKVVISAGESAYV